MVRTLLVFLSLFEKLVVMLVLFLHQDVAGALHVALGTPLALETA